MCAPLVKAEQHGSIRIQDLTKVVMAGRRLRLAEERLVPFETRRHVFHPDDRPRALHGTFRRPNEKEFSDPPEVLGFSDELDVFVARPI
jgi:hypothetical protein